MARILIADDDPHIVRVMSIWLTRHGHEVVPVHNGQEALDCVRAGSVDLVISDMNMPVMDGVSFVKAVRQLLHNNLPIIVLTARCDQDELVKSLAGYNARVYPKPFLPSQIVAEINQLLQPVAAPGSI